MAKAYILMMGAGDTPSDQEPEAVRVFLNKNRAAEIYGKLTEVRSRVSAVLDPKPPLYWNDYRKVDHMKEAVALEYAALGFRATVYDWWELNEVDLDEAP